jgi:hypothetical protein
MKFNQMAKLGFAMLLGLLAATTFGCRSIKPVAWHVNLNKVTIASVEVDVIGISPSEKPYWQSAKVDDYWQPGSSLRKDVANRRVSSDFRSGATWTLEQTNSIWQTWFNDGATELMIIARLPGSSFDNGPYDRRRIFVPLGKDLWKAKNRTLQIEVQDEFIRVLTPTRS